MAEADEIKQKKMEELQKKAELESVQKEKQKQAEDQLDFLLRKFVSEKAFQRLHNVKLVNKQLFLGAAQGIINMGSAQNLKEKLSDEQVKEILSKLSGEKKNFKIVRK